VSQTAFYRTIDNLATTTIGYTAGSGQIPLAAGVGPAFGNPTAGAPILVSTFSADGTPQGVYTCTGRSGDTLIGVALVGGTDTTLPAGAAVQVRWTAEHVSQITAAIGAIEADYLTSASSLDGAKVSGNIAGNAAGITGTVAGAQVSGNIAGNAANVTGTVADSSLALSSRLSAAASASAGGINLVGSPSVNVVGAGADTCVVLGGTSTFPHSVGNAALACIPGGYDNHVGGNSIMAVLLGAHLLVDATNGHGSIGGGSYHAVHGDYGRVGGGTQNVVVGNYSAVGGGRQNSTGTAVTTLSAQANIGDATITTVTALVAGRKVFVDYGALTEGFTVLSVVGNVATLSGPIASVHASGSKVVSDGADVTDAFVGGGQSNAATHTEAAICGGFNNKAQGTASYVGGGSNNNASQTNSSICGGDQNVANGTFAAVGGGQLNTASASYSVVAGGRQNTASGASYAVVAGGFSNTASGSESAIGGGDTNTASGSFSVICGGFQNTASGLYSGVPSGRGGRAYKNYSRVLAGGFFAAAGDAQSWELPMRRSTANATATELRSDGAGEQLDMPDNTCWRFTARIAGWRTDTHTPVADLKLEGMIARGTGAATTALFGTVTKTAGSANAAGTDANATADTTLGGLSLKVTGLAGVTIYWSARVEVIEVAG
jgi:hypothetical protein